MAAAHELVSKKFIMNKKRIQEIVAEQNQRMEFLPDPSATPEKAQAMTEALGIRPEENLLSRDIITARDAE